MIKIVTSTVALHTSTLNIFKYILCHTFQDEEAAACSVTFIPVTRLIVHHKREL